MTLRRYDNFIDPEVKKMHQDITHNFSFDDIKAGDLKTDAPTTATIDKGRMRLVEESGVPVIYYRTVAGTLYKWTGTAA